MDVLLQHVPMKKNKFANSLGMHNDAKKEVPTRATSFKVKEQKLLEPT